MASRLMEYKEDADGRVKCPMGTETRPYGFGEICPDAIKMWVRRFAEDISSASCKAECKEIRGGRPLDAPTGYVSCGWMQKRREWIVS